MTHMVKRRFLKTAIVLTLLGGTLGSGMPVKAYDTYILKSNTGKEMFEAYVFNEGEVPNPIVDIAVDYPEHSSYTLTPTILQSVFHGVQYWTDMLAPGSKNTQPQQLFIGTGSFNNAEAGIMSWENGSQVYENYLSHLFQKNIELVKIDLAGTSIPDKGNSSLSTMYIGQNLGIDQHDGAYGFSSSVLDSIVPETERTIDLTLVIRHEIAHSLGFTLYFKDSIFKSGIEIPQSYAAHLVDAYGHVPKKGMKIVNEFMYKMYQKFHPDKLDNYFVITGEDEPLFSGSGIVYFKGTHVSEVLDGTKFIGVEGLPIMGQGDLGPELAHLALPRVLMSHSPFISYSILTESELALMQDLGYQIDRRNYFGHTVIGNDITLVNHNGYWARNTEGTAYLQGQYNSTALGVGLHIYGNNNTVTQAADIMTRGSGAVGIIIDGTNNTLNLADDVQVHADGTNGNGILVLYGKNNSINQYGTVMAAGNLGTGVRFDFGSNGAGPKEYRGSYIKYSRTINEGEISIANDISPDDAIKGPLVTTYNIFGNLSGNANAIYIAKNALVDQINVQNGASISGNITSDWKKFHTTDNFYDMLPGLPPGCFNESLVIQYNNERIPYDAYIPDLVTKLNFDADMAYDGNITGTDNMKLNVTGHTLTYTGKADVINVQVDQGATLLGGTYKVNDMTTTMAAGYSDDTTGKFINKGTIGAITPSSGDTSMNIIGTLEQNGTVQFTAKNKFLGYVDVDGAIANAADAKLRVDPKGIYRPSYAYTANIVRSGGQGANLTYAGLEPYSTDLLTAAYDPQAATVTFTPARTLAGGTYNQNQALQAMNDMTYTGSEAVQEQLLGIYNGKGTAIGRTLSEISGEAKTGAAVANLMRTPIRHAVLARMHELQDTYGHGAMGPCAKPELMTLDNSIWARVSKGWGELSDNDASYNTFDMTVGYDKAHGNYWRHGILADYGTLTFAGTDAHADTKDWRIGLYSTYENGRNHGFVYADYGWQDTDFYRSLPLLGRTAKGSYDSRTVEIGGEYKYDLYPAGTTTWQISPYAALQATHYKQDSYTEHGADMFNQIVSGMNETYTAGTAGIEISRTYRDGGSIALRAGYKKAFSGTNPKLQYRLAGSGSGSTYNTTTEQDRNFLVLGLAAEKQITPKWSVKGDIDVERGSHDKQLDASLSVRYRW